MNCKEVRRNNKMARQAFLIMLKCKTAQGRNFWAASWLLHSYFALRALRD